ncbi:MAG: hypothetical protein JXR83_14650, partial [Deltaproteobacteria bacterium]|nr:hypothetical protein [Deltaproteobacteria bacterium]
MRAREVLLAGALALLGAACTQGELLPVPQPDPGKLDNRIKVSGEFCTTDPDTLRYPVKIFFVVDQSGSLNAVDPPDTQGETQRLNAMVDAFTESIQGRVGVEVAIAAFGAATRVLTSSSSTLHCPPCDGSDPTEVCQEGFTDCAPNILGAMVNATTSTSGGNTNYISALSV